MKKSLHVISTIKDGWNVKKGGATKATKHFTNKKKAIDYARVISKNQHTELYIHNTDGSIQTKETWK